MERIRINKKIYRITNEMQKTMEKSGLSMLNVRTRVLNGWSLKDATSAPLNMRLEEWLNSKGVLVQEQSLNKAQEQSTLKERMEQQKVEELKRKKPHLFTVPQTHQRGEWCKYLMQNDIFPKVGG